MRLHSLADAKWDHERFVDFLLRSKVTLTLTRLVLYGPPITERELLQTLDILPSLEYVHLMEWFDYEAVSTKEVFSHLITLPKLVSVDLALDHGALYLEDVALFDQMAFKQLRRLYMEMHWREPMDEDVLFCLHELQSEVVTLQYCNSCIAHLYLEDYED